MSDIIFYQIRLFSKGKIEIFQNVFRHKIHIEEREAIGIKIEYSGSKNTGLCSIAQRPLEDVYQIEIIDTSEFEPAAPNPRDKKISIYGGKGKPWHYFPKKKL